MLPKVTMEGTVTADPALRFTPSGVAVATFSIAMNDRKKDDQTGKWENDGDPLFIRVTCWRQLAENVAESLAKGDLVLVTGKLKPNNWEDKEGNPRKDIELVADTVAASLLFRTIRHGEGKAQRSSSTRGNDPWETPAAPQPDEPPF